MQDRDPPEPQYGESQGPTTAMLRSHEILDHQPDWCIPRASDVIKAFRGPRPNEFCGGELGTVVPAPEAEVLGFRGVSTYTHAHARTCTHMHAHACTQHKNFLSHMHTYTPKP